VRLRDDDRGGFRPVELIGDEHELSVVTLERLERRIGEECGQLRLDISGLHTEVADRSLGMVKWLLASSLRRPPRSER
jgi:hypothetical protein